MTDTTTGPGTAASNPVAVAGASATAAISIVAVLAIVLQWSPSLTGALTLAISNVSTALAVLYARGKVTPNVLLAALAAAQVESRNNIHDEIAAVSPPTGE